LGLVLKDRETGLYRRACPDSGAETAIINEGQASASQPEEGRLQALARGLAGHVEQVLSHLCGGLDAAQLDLLGVVQAQAPRGAFRSELMVARAIRDGRSQGAMLPVLYEFPEDIANDRSNPPAWQDRKH
jgi:hypothetical protein